MENNLNDNKKRVRKRIVVKREPDFNSTDPSKERNWEDLPKDLADNNYKPSYENRNNNFDKPFERNQPNVNFQKHSGFNNFKSSENKQGNYFKNNNFNKHGKGHPQVNDPTSKHHFFKKHEVRKDVNQPQELNKAKENEGLIRLNKFISNAGVCSRREADELITKGLITVNGTVITELGYKIDLKDSVEFKGKKISEANHVYILLNKPKDTITTTKDPENRVTVMDLVQKATHQRIFPIGRLDRNTTGVILLTNDGDFAQKLSHPSSEVKKVYFAVLDKPLEKEDFDTLLEGVLLDDGPMKADEVAYVDYNDRAMIGIEIHSGKNRIVHRMFEHLGYRLKKLDRVVYAGLDKGGLRRSKWRFLRYDEVQTVLNSIKYHDEKN